MERTYRTKEETIKYFKSLAYEFAMQSRKTQESTEEGSEAYANFLMGKAEAYEIAAFELEKNMQ